MAVIGVCCCCCHSPPVCLPTSTAVAPAVTQEISLPPTFLSHSLIATSVQFNLLCHQTPRKDHVANAKFLFQSTSIMIYMCIYELRKH